MEKFKNFFFSNSNVRQTVVKNTFWLFLGEVSGRVFKILLVIYAARNLGAEGWGIFSYTLSVASLLMIFTDVGIDNLITREISQKKENYKMFTSAALLIKGVILVISTALVIFVGPVISTIPAASNLFTVIAIILLTDAIRGNGFAINRTTDEMEKETLIKIVMNAIIFGLGFFLVRADPTPMSLAISYAVGGIIGTVLILGIVKNIISEFMVKVDKKTIKSVLKTVFPFTIIAVVGTILANTDVFMLGLWKTPKDIGVYVAVQRFYQFIAVVPAMITTATLPLISQLANRDNEKLKKIVEKILTIFMIIIIPMTLGGMILAQQIILLTFGAGYMQAIPVLQIVLLMALAAFPTLVFVNTVFVYDKQQKLILVNIFGVLVNVALNFILIPKLGTTGAALATLASTWTISFITWRKMKEINNFEIWPSIKIAFLPTLIMLAATLILRYMEAHVLLNIAISALLYSIVFLALKKKTFTEIRELLGIH